MNDSDTSDSKTKEIADTASFYKGNGANLPYNFGNISIHPRETLSIQPKLTINSPGDKYEQEADVMADKVTDITGAAVLPQEHVPVNVAHERVVARVPARGADVDDVLGVVDPANDVSVERGIRHWPIDDRMLATGHCRSLTSECYWVRRHSA